MFVIHTPVFIPNIDSSWELDLLKILTQLNMWAMPYSVIDGVFETNGVASWLSRVSRLLKPA